MNPPNQRLILLFDGTWNDPCDRTNVYRMAKSIHDYDGGIRQRFFYNPGVGTGFGTYLRGGIFGKGVIDNILEGYKWLAKHYMTGDEVYIFGFSRGAFTARSLVGLVRRCGFMNIVSPRLLKEAMKLYRKSHLDADDKLLLDFRNNYSRAIDIDMIGVWDTVGSLGIPNTNFSEYGLFSWHDTSLSKIVKRAYQAMALDEHREAFNIVFWTSKDGEKKPENTDVEQCWFIGAHANVGGGYKDNPLADISLNWMKSKAINAGLKLDQCATPTDANKGIIADSYREFLYGAYDFSRKIRFSSESRYFRYYDKDREGGKAINVTVHPSVWERWNTDTAYRPRTLAREDICGPE